MSLGVDLPNHMDGQLTTGTSGGPARALVISPSLRGSPHSFVVSFQDFCVTDHTPEYSILRRLYEGDIMA